MAKFREPSVGRYYEDAPQAEAGGVKSWITRGGNFAVVYSQGDAGGVITGEFADEHFVYITGGRVKITAGAEEAILEGESLAIVPPGASTIELLQAGSLIQMVTSAEAVAKSARNAGTYADGAPELAPPEPWPMPVGGYRLRAWSLPEVYASGGMVNAFRTRKLMMCPYPQWKEPRDTTALTPHSHNDFEQGSVALEGEWVHHLRVPWGPNLHDWRADEHLEVGSPSTTVIPAGIVHTSRGVAGKVDAWRLLDVFSPPRVDFSSRPGVVRNAEDYPMPAGLVAA